MYGMLNAATLATEASIRNQSKLNIVFHHRALQSTKCLMSGWHASFSQFNIHTSVTAEGTQYRD